MTVSELIEKLKQVEFTPHPAKSRDVYIQVGPIFVREIAIWIDKDGDVIIYRKEAN